MKNKFNEILIWLAITFLMFVIVFSIVYLFKLYIEYFPLGEKKNMDLFLIGLAILSIYYIIKSAVNFFRKKK